MTDAERGDWGSEKNGGIGVLSFEFRNRLLLRDPSAAVPTPPKRLRRLEALLRREDTRCEVQVAGRFWVHFAADRVEIGILGLLSGRL
jgi:hypothetical protein